MKKLGHRIRCPICGWLPTTRKLYMDHKLELFEQKGLGKGKGFEYIPVAIDDDFRNEFKKHFAKAIAQIIENELIDEKTKQDILDRLSPKTKTE